MAVHHVTITLGTGATPLIAQSGSNPTVNVQQIQLESETGNGDVKVGGSTVSATDYGRTLEAGPTKSITISAPQGLAINMASTFLFGTVTQKVHCLYVS